MGQGWSKLHLEPISFAVRTPFVVSSVLQWVLWNVATDDFRMLQ
jgi:hypothetical protein